MGANKAINNRAAAELREALDRRHAENIGQTLGCTVTIKRYESVRLTGKFSGIAEPVYAMPAEFIEQAQALGLLAEAE